MCIVVVSDNIFIFKMKADFVSGTIFLGILILKQSFFMVALWNRETIYIFMLWFVLSFFFFIPRLISAAADWMSAILPHMVWPQCEFKMQV